MPRTELRVTGEAIGGVEVVEGVEGRGGDGERMVVVESKSGRWNKPANENKTKQHLYVTSRRRVNRTRRVSKSM